MTVAHRRVPIDTRGRGFYDVTALVHEAARALDGADALVGVFVEHTSASLVFCENADPTVREDLERFAADLAPDGDRRWRHDDEGPDDMPAHVRSVLTLASVTIPIIAGRPALGTWQGLYLWEHRTAPHRRWLTVSTWR